MNIFKWFKHTATKNQEMVEKHIDTSVLVVYNDGGATVPVQRFPSESEAADWINSEQGGGGNWMLYDII